MKSLTLQVRTALLLTLILLAGTAAYSQITPLGDTYTNSAAPTTNNGAKTLLDVDGATQITYIQFNLASVPADASLSQATLKLYVNSVATAGAFQLYAVNGAWTESGLTFDLAPALGSVIDANVPITIADKNQYILIPMTATVQEWLTTPSSNFGIALVAVGTFNATFDSKESASTSHAPELDVVFAGDGTISGVTTASGSGLTGGGTSGTLNLSLTSACASGQVLEWNGTAWACTTPKGAGTVTMVASGAGLTGGPITGSGTLQINTTVVPQLGAANTFTGTQTVAALISDGAVNVDYLAANKGTELPGIQFGNSGTGEAISSNRSSTGANPFGLNFYTDYNPRISVMQGGNVGIGTQAPVYQLEVYAAAATKAQMAMVSAGTDAAFSVNNTATGGHEYWIDSGSGTAGVGAGNFAIWDNTALAARLTVNSTGRIGIGTQTPTAQLESDTPSDAGVLGTSSATVGVLGVSGGPSAKRKLLVTYPAGVWGDTDLSGATVAIAGVVGTADNNHAGAFYNTSDSYATITLFNAGSGGTGAAAAPILATHGSSGTCTIDSSGSSSCTGKVGADASVDGGARKVSLYAVQSPENWFEDAGSGQLSNGSARVELDSTFAQTVNAGVEYHVFLTPNGDSKGLYVSQKSARSFEVHEQGGGTSSIAFDYRIMAKRVGYENVRLTDVTAKYQRMEQEEQLRRERAAQPRAAHPSSVPQSVPQSVPRIPVATAASPMPPTLQAPAMPSVHSAVQSVTVRHAQAPSAK